MQLRARGLTSPRDLHGKIAGPVSIVKGQPLREGVIGEGLLQVRDNPICATGEGDRPAEHRDSADHQEYHQNPSHSSERDWVLCDKDILEDVAQQERDGREHAGDNHHQNQRVRNVPAKRQRSLYDLSVAQMRAFRRGFCAQV